MAYSATGWTTLNSDGVNSKFHYVTTDSLATVLGSGYFNTQAPNLRKGDTILVVVESGGTPHLYELVVTSNDHATTVVVSVGDGLPNAAYYVVLAGNKTTAGTSATEDLAITGALATDIPLVTIKDNGTNNVTLLQAVAGAAKITCTFSGDPGNDCVVNYALLRAV